MRLILDTHAFVFLASDVKKLPDRAKKIIEASSLFVSAISAFEMALLCKRQRLRLPIAPETFWEKALEQHGIEEIPIDRIIAMRAAALPDLHNDPFDRIIIATALEQDLVIVTKDGEIPKYPNVRIVWD